MSEKPKRKARLVWMIAGVTTVIEVALMAAMIVFTYGMGLVAFALVTIGGNLLASLIAFVVWLAAPKPATAGAVSLGFALSAVIAAVISAVVFMYLMVG